jgi:hypothetical protein
LFPILSPLCLYLHPVHHPPLGLHTNTDLFSSSLKLLFVSAFLQLSLLLPMHWKEIEMIKKHRRSASAVDLHFSNSNLRLCHISFRFLSCIFLCYPNPAFNDQICFILNCFLISWHHPPPPPPIFYLNNYLILHSNLIPFCLLLLHHDFIIRT